jgi:hypothetical protein
MGGLLLSLLTRVRRISMIERFPIDVLCMVGKVCSH